jgi:hypothetical protein
MNECVFKFLQNMQRMYENGHENLKTTIVSFGAVLQAWAPHRGREKGRSYSGSHGKIVRALHEYKVPTSILPQGYRLSVLLKGAS